MSRTNGGQQHEVGQVLLSQVIRELGPGAFANQQTFLGLLRAPRIGEREPAGRPEDAATPSTGIAPARPVIFVTEQEVAESLFILTKRPAFIGDNNAGSSCAIETFIDSVGTLHPLFGWTTVFETFGAILEEKQAVMDNEGWLLLLRAWQRIVLQMDRVAKFAYLYGEGATGPGGTKNLQGEDPLAQPLPPPEALPPSDRRMMPLTVLPKRPENRLISSLVDFIGAHDRNYRSTLIPQTLLELPPSLTLLEVAHNLFYNHAQEVLEQHQLNLLSFLTRRLATPKESYTFLIRINSFLHEKLTALMNLYLAASQGKDPLQTLELGSKSTLILDGNHTMTYFNALFNYADASLHSNSPEMALFLEPRILMNFERLRLMAVEIYRDDAAAAGVDRRSFDRYMNNPSPTPQLAPGPPLLRKPVDTNRHSSLEAQEEFYFGCFYRRELSAAQLVDFIERLSACPANTFEADLLARMLCTLFTECRHFPKYPPVELHRTGEFFGKLIRSQLLLKRNDLQRLAIRCVLEALKKDVTTKIFRFGLVALQEFLPIAPYMPAFLIQVTKTPGLVEYFPVLVHWAETCLSLIPIKLRNQVLVDGAILNQSIAPRHFPPTTGVLEIPPAFRLVAGPIAAAHAQQSQSAATTTQQQAQPSRSQQAGAQTLFGTVQPPTANKRGEDQCAIRLQGFGLGQVENLLSEEPDLISQINFPPEPMMNRVAQIFNAMVPNNVHHKAAELSMLLQPEFHPWLAFYIVKTRVSKEPNHHDLYARAADNLHLPKIQEMLINVTYDCINVLLRYAASAREATSYRTVLKSLGSWLGLMTIGRNRPVKSKLFDIKHMLYDAFERGILIAVVPMVCSMLEHIKSSRNFKLPNPWTVSAFICLGCLYVVPSLKQTICFEIELLCQATDVDLQSFLHQAPNLFESLKYPPDSPDFQHAASSGGSQSASAISAKPKSAARPAEVETVGGARAATLVKADSINNKSTSNVAELPQAAVAAVAPSQSGSGDLGSPLTDVKGLGQPGSQLLQALRNTVVISRSLTLFQKHQELKVAVPIAIERAVRDLVGVISERAVILAVGTTIELVLKDFCFETEEVLVKRAGQLMAASLGGSIVMVTARSPLRVAIIQNLKELIRSVDTSSSTNGTDPNESNDSFVDQTVQVVAADNLNIASLLIEQVVVDQAVQGAQEALAPHLAARAGSKPGTLIRDPAYTAPDVKWPAGLPPPLKISPFLGSKQLQVYKDFAQFGPLRRIHETPNAFKSAKSTAENEVYTNGTAAPPQHPLPTPLQHNDEIATAVESESRNKIVQNPNKFALSQMPPPATHLSPQRVLTSDASFAAIDTAVSALKEGVKELVCSPTSQFYAEGTVEVIIPEGSVDHIVPAPAAYGQALRMLSTLPSNHDVFTQIDLVVRLVQLCKQPEMVALSTSRRLLKSIHDAASRLVHQSNSDIDSDISRVYLEAFVALLKRFDLLKLVPMLKEVIFAWLVNTGMVAGQQGGNGSGDVGTSPRTLDIRRFPQSVSVQVMLILTTAARYDLVRLSEVDSQFTSVVLKQAIGILTESAEEEKTLTPALLAIVQNGIEFALQTVYILGIEFAILSDPKEVMKESLAQMEIIMSLPESEERVLESVVLSYPTSLTKALVKKGSATVKEALEYVLEKFADPPARDEGMCMTIEDILKFKIAHGDRPDRRVVSALMKPIMDGVEAGVEPGSLLMAMQNGHLKPGRSMEAALAVCVEQLCCSNANGNTANGGNS